MKYYKGVKGLICEIKCIADDEEIIFQYEFDKKNHLQRIKKITNTSQIYVYDRQKELHTAQNEYFKAKNQIRKKLKNNRMGVIK